MFLGACDHIHLGLPSNTALLQKPDLLSFQDHKEKTLLIETTTSRWSDKKPSMKLELKASHTRT